LDVTAGPYRRLTLHTNGLRPDRQVWPIDLGGRVSLERTFDYDRVMGGLTADELAALVTAAPGPPLVTAHGVTHEPVPAALLVWGRRPDGAWAAGIAFLLRHWSRRALITMWVPAAAVQPHHHADYSQVPRVELAGGPDAWPPLPPRYPHAGAEWIAAHEHVIRPDPDNA
jgi:hypothetical protein